MFFLVGDRLANAKAQLGAGRNFIREAQNSKPACGEAKPACGVASPKFQINPKNKKI